MLGLLCNRDKGRQHYDTKFGRYLVATWREPCTEQARNVAKPGRRVVLRYRAGTGG